MSPMNLAPQLAASIDRMIGALHSLQLVLRAPNWPEPGSTRALGLARLLRKFAARQREQADRAEQLAARLEVKSDELDPRRDVGPDAS